MWISTITFRTLSSSVIVGTKERCRSFWDRDQDSSKFDEIADPAYRGWLKQFFFTPGEDCFIYFQHAGSFFALYRVRQPKTDNFLLKDQGDIRIYYFSWNRKGLDHLLKAIQKADIDSRRGQLLTFGGYQDGMTVQWRTMCKEPRRHLHSLVMEEHFKEAIISDMRWFLASQGQYEEEGILYRRGYPFYGLPGVGKTSFIRAIASELGIPIYTVSLAIVDDYGIQELFRTLPSPDQRCLVLLEDIDSAGIGRDGTPADQKETSGSESPKKKGITLASVLNSLDGIGAHQGHMLVVTTNVRPSLDVALTRPGRIDRQFEFLYPKKETIKAHFSFAFAGKLEADVLNNLASEFAQAIPDRFLSPADLQEYFLRCKGNPTEAIRNVHILVRN
ncbi:hypothetical protein N7486_002102 [Penicillium sp. IBT 16267x]|nr:hypothetical protein N7486_002102 [Penicillium sp. IBT 16267x]